MIPFDPHDSHSNKSSHDPIQLEYGTTAMLVAFNQNAPILHRTPPCASPPSFPYTSSFPLRARTAAIMNYYNSRPLTLLSRLAEVSYRLGSLALKLWLDKKIGDGGGWEKNMDSRAAEFLEFVQGAGPAFIKIGQGVSIRPDILPEAYLKELVKLQDKVGGWSCFWRVSTRLLGGGVVGVMWTAIGCGHGSE